MNDILDADAIYKMLGEKISIEVFDTIDSTNTYLKNNIRKDIYKPGLVLADRQSMGRGRLGRNFESPQGTGIYMSILIPYDKLTDKILLITSMTAVALVSAIRELTDKKPLIKWVNDIYLNNKKICGILAESVTDSKGRLCVVVGIGINFMSPKEGFSKEVEQIAGALYEGEADISRNELAAGIVNEFLGLYKDIEKGTFMEKYRKWSLVIGKDVRFLRGDIWREGKARDIQNDGSLVVECEDGLHELNTGEITLRMK